MFLRSRNLQYHVRPDRPDPIFARQLQEVLGGQWGEISVMMTYLFQGWNCLAPEKYKDMIMDIGTEEIGHVEMLATMIARLLEQSPVEAQENAAKDSVIGAMMGRARLEDAIVAGMNPQHAIAGGGCAQDMLSFLIARDTMHQNQWLAAIEELAADGLETTPCPSSFPQESEQREAAYQFLNFSEGNASSAGRWANGPSPDGRGTFTCVDSPGESADVPELGQIDPRLHGTPRRPVPASTKPAV